MIKEETANLSMQEEELDKKKKNLRKNQISNFISKTFKILEDKDNFEIISWTDNGNSFIVKDKQKFESIILPKYFKHSKFSSFVRQLNMYDFHKLRKEKEIQVFRHKYFKMNKKELLKKIKRKCLEENVDNGDNNPVDEEVIDNQQHKSSEQNSLVAQNQLQTLAKQNQELYRDIQNYKIQLKHLNEIKNSRREKLIKIINACIYFNMESEQTAEVLQAIIDHFRNPADSVSQFIEYKKMLAKISSNLIEPFISKQKNQNND